MERVLTRRELNRTLLVRQDLIERIRGFVDSDEDPKGLRREIEREGERLVSFLAPEAGPPEISFLAG